MSQAVISNQEVIFETVVLEGKAEDAVDDIRVFSSFEPDSKAKKVFGLD